jgi:hypothetical protein
MIISLVVVHDLRHAPADLAPAALDDGYVLYWLTSVIPFGEIADGTKLITFANVAYRRSIRLFYHNLLTSGRVPKLSTTPENLIGLLLRCRELSAF